MSAPELAWRLNTGLGSGLRERRARRGSHPFTWGGAMWASSLLDVATASAAEFEVAAERIASGGIELWGTPVLIPPTQPNWRRHPFVAEIWPRGSWRKWARDPKPVWELHRHQHLVPLAMGAALAGRADWARTGVLQLLAWVERCPRGTHPGWSSAYEVANRLVSWTWALPLLADQATSAELARLEESFAAQARFVAARPSRYSSANNHRLAELTGLLAATLVQDDPPGWRKAWRQLEIETARQTYSDGGSREQAAGYFLYVLEILTAASQMARGCAQPLGAIDERLRSMLEWLEHVAGEDGEPPPLGDDAEDRMLRLDYFQARSAPAIAGRARSVLDDRPLFSGAFRRESRQASRILRESGLAVIRGEVDGEGVRVVFDIGELGFGRLAAHGHADALSVLIDVGGVSLLRDSGTGSYARAEGRDEFRVTAAHNTVVVDGASQARALGPHLWGQRYRVDCESSAMTPTIDYVRASHDGYRALPAGAHHTRSVVYLKPDIVVVLDRVRSRQECDCLLSWHLAPGDTPSSLGGGRGALAVAAVPAAAGTAAGARFSRRYASQCTAPVWRWPARGQDVVMATVVALGAAGSVVPPRMQLTHDGATTVVRVDLPRPALVVERWHGESIEVTG